MSMWFGRLEKRIRLAIPMRGSSLKEPSAEGRSPTENICSMGLRVLVRHRLEPNERLLIKSVDGELQAAARVVYCERLLDGRFALGLEFHEEATNWRKKSLSYGD